MERERFKQISKDTLKKTGSIIYKTLTSPKTPIVAFVANASMLGINSARGDVQSISLNAAATVVAVCWGALKSRELKEGTGELITSIKSNVKNKLRSSDKAK